jgi:hypothetical protein
MRNNKALRHRCPVCKKLRRFYEPSTGQGGEAGGSKKPGQRAGWTKDADGRWVCLKGKCAKEQKT